MVVANVSNGLRQSVCKARHVLRLAMVRSILYRIRWRIQGVVATLSASLVAGVA